MRNKILWILFICIFSSLMVLAHFDNEKLTAQKIDPEDFVFVKDLILKYKSPNDPIKIQIYRDKNTNVEYMIYWSGPHGVAMERYWKE
jgi:hypothetical protein